MCPVPCPWCRSRSHDTRDEWVTLTVVDGHRVSGGGRWCRQSRLPWLARLLLFEKHSPSWVSPTPNTTSWVSSEGAVRVGDQCQQAQWHLFDGVCAADTDGGGGLNAEEITSMCTVIGHNQYSAHQLQCRVAHLSHVHCGWINQLQLLC